MGQRVLPDTLYGSPMTNMECLEASALRSWRIAFSGDREIDLMKRQGVFIPTVRSQIRPVFWHCASSEISDAGMKID